jgi:hypothetical protein
MSRARTPPNSTVISWLIRQVMLFGPKYPLSISGTVSGPGG